MTDVKASYQVKLVQCRAGDVYKIGKIQQVNFGGLL